MKFIEIQVQNQNQLNKIFYWFKCVIFYQIINPIMTGGGHYVPAEFSRLFFSNFLLNTMVRYFLTFHIYV